MKKRKRPTALWVGFALKGNPLPRLILDLWGLLAMRATPWATCWRHLLDLQVFLLLPLIHPLRFVLHRGSRGRKLRKRPRRSRSPACCRRSSKSKPSLSWSQLIYSVQVLWLFYSLCLSVPLLSVLSIPHLSLCSLSVSLFLTCLFSLSCFCFFFLLPHCSSSLCIQ